MKTTILIYRILIALLGIYIVGQIYFKINGAKTEGYGNAIISLGLFLMNLPFLVIFIIKKKTKDNFFVLLILFQILFFLGIFLANTLFWMMLLVILSFSLQLTRTK